MHNLGARQSWIPVAQIRCSVGHKWRCNETHSVNESHLGQQRLRATRIPADDIRSSAGVKSIRRLHGVLNLRFNVGDEPHAATYELKVRMNPCHMCQKKRDLPLRLGVINQDMPPFHRPHSTHPLSILSSNQVTEMHPCS